MAPTVIRAYDPLRDSVNFLLERHGRTIICVASRPYLMQRVNPEPQTPLELLRAFDVHREWILAIARRKIERGCLESDQSVMLRPEDEPARDRLRTVWPPQTSAQNSPTYAASRHAPYASGDARPEGLTVRRWLGWR